MVDVSVTNITIQKKNKKNPNFWGCFNEKVQTQERKKSLEVNSVRVEREGWVRKLSELFFVWVYGEHQNLSPILLATAKLVQENRL